MYRHKRRTQTRGFTLIEILVVMGMIGILAGTVLVAVNPLKQFAQARNTQRVSNVNAILNAIGNRIADNNGMFASDGTCNYALPTNEAKNISDTGEGIDLRPCLVPKYIPELPYDPSLGMNECTTDSCAGHSYNTRYAVQLLDSHRIQICAPGSVDDGLSKPYCLTR
jgi:prepilin-type N-terminal cleavage/methylation domain-containing protein